MTEEPDIGNMFAKDDLRIVHTEIIRDKARSENKVAEYKVIFGMVTIAIILAASIWGFFSFPDDGKKYAAAVGLLNLILGSVLGYMYGALGEKRNS